MSSITKNISVTFIAKIISTILTLGSSIFLTRLLGREGNGAYGYIMANVNLFVVLLGFGMARTMTYFVAKKDTNSANVSGIGLYISLGGLFIFSIFTFLVYFTKSPFIDFLLPKGYVSLFILFFMIGNFTHKAAINYFIGVWQGTLQFNQMNITLIIGNAIRLLTLAGLWGYIQFSKKDITIRQILNVVLLIIILDILIRLFVFIKTKSPVNLKVFTRSNLSKSIIIFGTLGIATRVLNFANKRLDIWFVEAYEGLEELGVYLLAVGLIDMIIATIVPGVQVLIPYYTQRKTRDQIDLLSKFSRLNCFLSALLILFVAILSVYIIPILYGNDFRDSVDPFVLLCIGAYFLLVRNIFTSFNVATNKQEINLKANVIALIITILLDIILIPKLGYIGACYASIFAYLISCVYVVFRIVKQYNLLLINIFLVKKSDLVFLINILSRQLDKIKYGIKR